MLIKKRFTPYLSSLLVGGIVVSLLTGWYAFAQFTPPQDPPPTCVAGDPGCDPPLNVSNNPQTKLGSLSVNISNAWANGFTVPFGNVGIGTASPVTELHLFESLGGAVIPQPAAHASNVGHVLLLQTGDPAPGNGTPLENAADAVTAIVFQHDEWGASKAWEIGSHGTNFTLHDLNTDNAPYQATFIMRNGGNVGIGFPLPISDTLVTVGVRLQVNGGVQLRPTDNTSTAVNEADRPWCDGNTRGTLWFQEEPAGTGDTLWICRRDASGSYAWDSML